MLDLEHLKDRTNELKKSKWNSSKKILHENKHLRNFLTHENADSNFQFSVLSIVESQIIPRLLNAQKIRTRHLSLVSSLRKLPSQKEIEKFADLCVSQDPKVAQAFVDHCLEIGLRKEDIFLELIAPAARYLGSQWDDECMDFSIPSSANELVQAVSQEWFDVVGLSISMEQQLLTLAELISQFKCSSVNPRVAVLLGGPIFAVKELRAIDFGADDICVNAKHAVGLAASLLP